MASKIETLGLGERVQELQVRPDGSLRPPNRIAQLLQDEGYKVGAAAVQGYLKKLAKERKPYVKQAIRETVTPHSISTMSILEEQILQGQAMLQALGVRSEGLLPSSPPEEGRRFTPDILAGRVRAWSFGAKTLRELLVTRLEILGLKLEKPRGMTDEELLREYERLERQRVAASGGQKGNGTTGTPSTPGFPN